MKTSDFLKTINDFDDDLILESMETAPVRTGNRIKKLIICGTAAAAVLLLAVFAFIQVRNQIPAYASEINWIKLQSQTSDDKVTFLSGFDTYPDGASMHILVAVNDLLVSYFPEIITDEENYEKLCQSYENGTLSSEELENAYHTLQEKESEMLETATQSELKFFNSIGASDAVSIGFNCFTMTIKNSDLAAFEKGKCTYRIILSSKSVEIPALSLENIYGNYQCVEHIYTPAYSSITFGDISDATLTIDYDGFCFVSSYITVSASNISYSIDSTERTPDNFWGMDRYAFSLPNEGLSTLVANDFLAINAGSDYKIYLTQDSLYMDFGLRGILRFEKIK